MLGVLFTIIALVALIALVLVRSKAQTNSELVNTHVGVNPAAMSLASQMIVQVQSTSTVDLTNPTPVTTPSSPDALITPGTVMAAPVHLKLAIVAPNGIANTVLKPNAQLHVYFGQVSYGPYLPGEEGSGHSILDYAADTALNPSSCSSNCGQTLWKLDQTGLDAGSGTGWTITPNPTDVTKADIDVTVPLPYYALPGWWNVYWEIDPVNDSGALDTDYAMFNPGGVVMHRMNDTRTFVAPIWFKLGEMVAMDVSPTGLTYLKAGGAPMEPDSDSDYKTLTLKGKGNVDTNVSAYGDPAGWTCSSGQSFSVNQTHFGHHMVRLRLTRRLHRF